jgi:hypothetical protein
MTPQELVQEWRQRAKDACYYNPDVEDADTAVIERQEQERDTLNECADELEKALTESACEPSDRGTSRS